jgi:malonyl-CoA decarboxylase
MVQGLMSRGLSKMRELMAQASFKKAEPTEKTLERVRLQLHECAQGRGGEVSTRQRAAKLAQTYLGLDDAGQHAFLRLIALEFGPQPERVAQAHTAYQAAVGTDGQWDAEADLRAAMRSSRLRILTQFASIDQGVKFLVDMRADLLRFQLTDPVLKPLDRELQARLAAWFDVGFLELSRITWQSPAALLEKLVQYEAVHAIRSWSDLKNRLDSDRRCYGFFHPRMPLEPLIFVEVALVAGLADNVQALLDEQAPVADSRKASTAVFYSISNTQTGLRGISFGNFLIKRVVADLQRDFPHLNTFATLSPMPGLVRWAQKNPEAWLASFGPADIKRLAAAGVAGGVEHPLVQALLTGNEGQGAWPTDAAVVQALREPLLKFAAFYLLHARRGDGPADPVARFHLGNGARVEQLNWLADTSDKGLAQSWGMMVNYLYDPDRIEANLESYESEGRIDAAAAIKRMAKR